MAEEKSFIGLKLLGFINVIVGITGIVSALLVIYFGYKFIDYFGLGSIAKIVLLSLTAIMTILIILGVVMIIVGYGLIRGRPWGYVFEVILAIFGLIASILTLRPFIGIFWFIVLFYLLVIFQFMKKRVCESSFVSVLCELGKQGD